VNAQKNGKGNAKKKTVQVNAQKHAKVNAQKKLLR
jgi:hypothetical protein